MKNNVERLREAQSISQSDLAKAAGVSRQSIHALERGAHEPRLTLAYRVASALNSTVEACFPAPTGKAAAAKTAKAPAKSAAKKATKKAAKKR
jgi:putative transcriptional regulator